VGILTIFFSISIIADGPSICPNPSPPTFQDSIQLFQIFLANIVRLAYVAAGSSPPPGEIESINSHHPLEADGDLGDGIAVGFGIDAGMAAARFMFDIVKKYYLVKVFPECARRLNLLKDEGKGTKIKNSRLEDYCSSCVGLKRLIHFLNWVAQNSDTRPAHRRS